MRLLVLVAGLLAAGTVSCNDDLVDGDADVDSDIDADGDTDTDTDADTDPEDPCFTALPVDLLWVIDNSHSMREEQANLALNFSTLMEVLTNPPDSDGNGHTDYPPVEDLRVGIVTTDMGVGENTVLGCDAAGDDGDLVTASRSDREECVGLEIGPDPWLGFHTGDDTAAFTQQFACLALLGTEGCGFEQQLDAMLSALIDHADPGEPNAGFVRPDSLIAVVFLTDEDDCSAADDSIFDPTPAAVEELGPYGTRCAMHQELLHPFSHYVTALDPLRLDRPAGMVVAAITGVPPDLVTVVDEIDYDTLLADERMQYQVDPDDETNLVPACSAVSVGSAIPARRMVEFVRTFSPGERGLVQSICSTDLRPAMEAIARLIARRLCDRPY
jgi:hypothetical protein